MPDKPTITDFNNLYPDTTAALGYNFDAAHLQARFFYINWLGQPLPNNDWGGQNFTWANKNMCAPVTPSTAVLDWSDDIFNPNLIVIKETSEFLQLEKEDPGQPGVPSGTAGIEIMITNCPVFEVDDPTSFPHPGLTSYSKKLLVW